MKKFWISLLLVQAINGASDCKQVLQSSIVALDKCLEGDLDYLEVANSAESTYLALEDSEKNVLPLSNALYLKFLKRSIIPEYLAKKEKVVTRLKNILIEKLFLEDLLKNPNVFVTCSKERFEEIFKTYEDKLFGIAYLDHSILLKENKYYLWYQLLDLTYYVRFEPGKLKIEDVKEIYNDLIKFKEVDSELLYGLIELFCKKEKDEAI